MTMGLLQLFMNKGLVVQPYKVGPDFVDTEYHSRITGRPAQNLDQFLVPDEKNFRRLFARAGQGADLAIIEGVMGLFDGAGLDKDDNSTAGISKALSSPVLLVIDGRAASTSVAAVCKGFYDFDPGLDFLGVVINGVSSRGHYQMVRAAIEKYTQARVLGYLPKNPDFSLPSRSLGLVPEGEMEGVRAKVQAVATCLDKTLDWRRILDLLEKRDQGQKREEVRSQKLGHKLEAKPTPSFRVAYAYDRAFHFYYQDNLEALEERGGVLVPFSILEGEDLPEADFYYIGGGYPDLYAKALSQNKKMAEVLRDKAEGNIPIYAEGGGLVYLSQGLDVGEQVFSMAGVLPGQVHMVDRLQHFGYCNFQVSKACLLGPPGTQGRANSFHKMVFESDLEGRLDMVKYRDGKVRDRWKEGWQVGNSYGSFINLNFNQEPGFLTPLVHKIQEVKAGH